MTEESRWDYSEKPTIKLPGKGINGIEKNYSFSKDTTPLADIKQNFMRFSMEKDAMPSNL